MFPLPGCVSLLHTQQIYTCGYQCNQPVPFPCRIQLMVRHEKLNLCNEKSQVRRITRLFDVVLKTGMCRLALSCGEFIVSPPQPFCESLWGTNSWGQVSFKLNFLVLFYTWEWDIRFFTCHSAVWTFPNIMADAINLRSKGVRPSRGDMVNKVSSWYGARRLRTWFSLSHCPRIWVQPAVFLQAEDWKDSVSSGYRFWLQHIFLSWSEDLKA